MNLMNKLYNGYEIKNIFPSSEKKKQQKRKRKKETVDREILMIQIKMNQL